MNPKPRSNKNVEQYRRRRQHQLIYQQMQQHSQKTKQKILEKQQKIEQKLLPPQQAREIQQPIEQLQLQLQQQPYLQYRQILPKEQQQLQQIEHIRVRTDLHQPVIQQITQGIQPLQQQEQQDTQRLMEQVRKRQEQQQPYLQYRQLLPNEQQQLQQMEHIRVRTDLHQPVIQQITKGIQPLQQQEQQETQQLMEQERKQQEQQQQQQYFLRPQYAFCLNHRSSEMQQLRHPPDQGYVYSYEYESRAIEPQEEQQRHAICYGDGSGVWTPQMGKGKYDIQSQINQLKIENAMLKDELAKLARNMAGFQQDIVKIKEYENKLCTETSKISAMEETISKIAADSLTAHQEMVRTREQIENAQNNANLLQNEVANMRDRFNGYHHVWRERLPKAQGTTLSLQKDIFENQKGLDEVRQKTNEARQAIRDGFSAFAEEINKDKEEITGLKNDLEEVKKKNTEIIKYGVKVFHSYKKVKKEKSKMKKEISKLRQKISLLEIGGDDDLE